MALTRTLLQLRTELRQRCDVSSTKLPDDEATRLINSSLAELYDLLVSVNKDFFLSSSDLNIVAGTATYSLPGTFWRAVGVDYQDGSDWWPMGRFTFAERNQRQNSGAGKEGTRYRVMGANLRLSPTPDWSGTVRIWYIPAPTALSGDSDTFDGVCGWEEYAIVDAVIKYRSKREEDATLEIAQKKALFARIKASAADRDDGQPDRVRDVYAEGYGGDMENVF